MLDVAIVKSSDHDPRANKIIKSLGKRYSILVLGWSRRGDNRISIFRSLGATEVKLFSLKAPIGRARIALYLPLFWVWVFFRLLLYRPRVIHACDLDTFFPSYLYKKILNKKLVFDVFDRYAMNYISPKNRITYSFVHLLEELCATKSDVLINTTKKIEHTFKKIPMYHEIIFNCSEEVSVTKKPPDNIFTIAFMGHLRRHRGLETLLNIVKDLEGVKLVISGTIGDPSLLEEVRSARNAEYVGFLKPEDFLNLEACCDVMINLYDLNAPMSQFIIGNKMFEAMMLGLPIITNVGSEIIHDEVKCGIIVDYNNADEIRFAIETLKDNKVRRSQLGENGRKAFLHKYNWKVMEEKLYGIYDRLVKEI